MDWLIVILLSVIAFMGVSIYFLLKELRIADQNSASWESLAHNWRREFLIERKKSK